MKGIVSSMIGCLLFFMAQAGKVDTITVYSESMKKQVKCVVVTPAKYDGREKLPVVYLLHGWSGNYAQWTKDAPQLPGRADEMNMIFVCPDGGYNSWYFDSPVKPDVRYETFITKELISYIDAHYKTLADRRFRAISGLSMGGHGAMYLAMRHKELFSAAGSIAGGVDFRPFPKNWELAEQLGDTACCRANWDKNVVMNVSDGLRNGELKLIIDCGLDDFFLPVNRALHQKLMAYKIDHDYAEKPGGHNRAYWGNSIDYHLLYFRKAFDSNKPDK